MTQASTHSVALTGLRGHLVEIQAEVIAAPAGLTLSGLRERAWRETRDRVRAAIINSAESWPHDHVAVTVTPGVQSSQGSRFDLAIAVAILAAAGRIPCPPFRHGVFLGELGLDGALRPVRGVLPAATVAGNEGFVEVVVPDSNAAEAALATGIRVTGAPSLAAVLHRMPMLGSAAALRTATRSRHSPDSSVPTQ